MLLVIVIYAILECSLTKDRRRHGRPKCWLGVAMRYQ